VFFSLYLKNLSGTYFKAKIKNILNNNNIILARVV